MKNLLILGGSDQSARRLAQQIASWPNCRLFILDYDKSRARQTADELVSDALAEVRPLVLDKACRHFEKLLRLTHADVVIHTEGRFRNCSDCLIRSCIAAGVHYMDFDDRTQALPGIASLDEKARTNGVAVITGAGTLTALTTAIVDHYATAFGEVEGIDITVAPGNKTPRDPASLKHFLSKIGQPFRIFSGGRFEQVFGWMQPRFRYLGKQAGYRLVARMDVPDLASFPERYKVRNYVKFHAGLEVVPLYFLLYLLALATRGRLIKRADTYASFLISATRVFDFFGSSLGILEITMTGRDKCGKDKLLRWKLLAQDGLGVYVPVFPGVIIVRQLLSGEYRRYGVAACEGLVTPEQIQTLADAFDMTIEVHEIG